ncbi:Rtt10 protein [Saccharomycopsis crataegensis]|uniref:Rtt10 protein n=1 Tax=Saccharomycopsis crataegensis TaxID=43959 RepID=A0AAV5QGB5_9ASCO|nr:Rtt10 protein [Saccharomycopsis crataegensis]
MVSSSLVPHTHYGPVTALKFIPNTEFLIAGYGPFIKIFNYKTGDSIPLSKTHEDVKIFEKNKIHGIVISKPHSSSEPTNVNVLFYGGRSVSVLNFQTDILHGSSNNRLSVHETACNDWVISGDFHYADPKSIYLLTAHNIVIDASIVGDNLGGLQVNGSYNCNEKSILYSGSFTVLNDEVYVFSGTVMSGIYVWKLGRATTSGEVLHHLTGHEGSIFGIKSNDDATLAVSCSDDRSIKIWDLKTGNNIATGWGHGARIWYLEFFNLSTQVMSCSEDLTIRIWDFDIENGELECKKVIEGHSGKNVWAGAVNQQQLIGASGGNDGKIRLIDLDTTGDDTHELSVEYLTSLNYGKSVNFAKNETIKTVISGSPEGSNNDDLLIITSYCKIFHVSQNYSQVKLLNFSHELLQQKTITETMHFVNNFFAVSHIENDEWSIMVLTASSGYQLFVTLDGSLNVKDVTEFSILDLVDSPFSKITGVFPISKTPNFTYFLFESPNPNDPFIFIKYDVIKLQYLTESLTLLEKPKTRFTLTAYDYDETYGYLILGSRFVTMTVYDLHSKTTTNVLSPLQTWKKFLPGDTISQIKVVKALTESLLVWISLRDGTYLTLEISRNLNSGDQEDVIIQGFENLSLTNQTSNLKIDICQQNRVSKGGFLEGCIETKSSFQVGDRYIDDSTNILLYGFKSDYFYLYNETKGYEVWTELCGGSHRMWKLVYPKKQITDDLNQFRFYYVKASMLVIKNMVILPAHKFAKDLLVEGTHGREIRDIAISTTAKSVNNDNSVIYKLLATGSEDNTIKISKLLLNTNDHACQIKNYWTQRLHVSGLQSLKFLNDQYLISSAAREEFFIWKINDGTLGDDSKLYVHCYDTLVPSVAGNPDLRIMDFDYLPIYDNNNNNNTVERSLQGFFLCLVYSNSFIKVFYYDLVNKKFHLMVDDYYKDICILTIKFVVHSQKIHMVIGATDGFLTVYDVPVPAGLQMQNGNDGAALVGEYHHSDGAAAAKLGRPVITQQIHQNGIKTMCVSNRSESIDIVTGGDDNALGLFTLTFDNNGTITSGTIKAFSEDAASSTITSISPVSTSQFLVTSVDQVVRIWNTVDGLHLVDAKYVTIADTGSSDTTTFEDVAGNKIAVGAIGGVGLSVWKINND